MPKPFYLRLINLASPAVFDEVIAEAQGRRTGITAAGSLRVPRAGALRRDRQVVNATPRTWFDS